MSAYDALMKYSARTGKKPGVKRKNGKPEKAIVMSCMEWLRENDFSCHVVESKAVYSRSAGIYLSGQTDPGFSDIAGCTPDGIGCFIEVKAPKRRSDLKQHQRDFLISKIERDAFACCVDSYELLEKTYNEWLGLDTIKRGHYLLGVLPKKKSVD